MAKAQKIESGKLLINNIFSNENWFRIPEYQRPYVWDKDQVTELLDDVVQASNSNFESQYFLGSMVLKTTSKKEGQTTYYEHDVLDGQQRLTTLFLIIAVIRDLADDKMLRTTCQNAIFQQGNRFLGIPERLRIVFDIRQQVKDFINEFVKELGATKKETELKLKMAETEQDISVRNMVKAILTIRSYFLTEPINIGDFFQYLCTQVLMIYVSSEELEDSFRLFTVMNSRGVKLRNSDILKADNLGRISDDATRLEWAKKWEDAESYFAEDFDAFLSHLRTILVKQKATVSLLKEFEDNIYNPTSYDRSTKKAEKLPAILEKGEQTFEFVIRYKKHYEQLFDNENYAFNDSFELYNYLHLMKKGFEADFWIAPLLKFYDKFKTNGLLEFVRALDNKFANDWLLGFTPSQRIENVNAIIKTIENATISAQVLQNNCLLLNNNDLVEILEGNIYGRRAAKYILLKLDLLWHGHTTKFSMPDVISIEHILPQNPANGSIWKTNFTDEQREFWTDKLGNLTLISRRKNASQGNKDYNLKKEQYFKNNIELFSNSLRVFQQYPTWTLSDLEKNQAEVLSQIKKGFGI